ncbi:HTH-like domain-containing protein [Alloyangia pacifica]|uniref:HTH-like domain-containing protein n=1 Tax=Alloyangia pacifica TaxID=311180 RepID=A0A1I6VFJ8_9RHOB|nr:HTH-like domain-containing protein [Alloyangia pacifica]SFT12523.1 HTH-like domain-containing protein [Alloyangia pacifica]
MAQEFEWYLPEHHTARRGDRKVWRQLAREGFDVARRTEARLMKDMGIQSARHCPRASGG